MEPLENLFHICFVYVIVVGLLHYSKIKMFRLFPRIDEMRWYNMIISILFIIAVFLCFTLILAHEIVILFETLLDATIPPKLE